MAQFSLPLEAGVVMYHHPAFLGVMTMIMVSWRGEDHWRGFPVSGVIIGADGLCWWVMANS